MGNVQCPNEKCQHVFTPPPPPSSPLVLNEQVRLITCPKCKTDFKVRA